MFLFLYKRKPVEDLKHLLVSQFNIVDRFYELIDREIKHVQQGKDGHIIVKLNNLEENGMIDKLYEASNAGVKIELIVRGICRLIPGVIGMSENITIRRLVGRFLEHARIFVFSNLGEKEIFMGSADWMGRNLYKRVEVIFPVYDSEAKEEILKLLELQLTDNVHARLLDQSYSNVSIVPNEEKVEAQSDFYKWLKSREVESDD